MLAVLLSAALPGFSQDKPVIPYVDLGTAQTLVDTLQRENETLKADADRLRREAAVLTGQITASRKAIDELVPVLEEVRARNSELATLQEALVDRKLRTQALGAAEKNKAGEKRLVKRIEELGARTTDLGKQIEAKLFQAAVNEARINRNHDDIVLLQATLAKTRAQEAKLQLLLDQVDALAAKVDSVLQQTAPAP